MTSCPVRAVLDTCVLVAALRSPTGASGSLLLAALQLHLRPLISVPPVLEYEAVLTRPEHLAFSGFTAEQVVKLVKAVCSLGEPVHLAHRLRPQLRDPDDEFVLETAYHGRADVIVTFNKRDFAAAEKFGIEAITPAEALERLKES